MGQLLVRNLNDDVHQWLRERGARHGRSMEAEARDILSRAHRTEVDDPVGQILKAMEGRGAAPVEVTDQGEHEGATFE